MDASERQLCATKRHRPHFRMAVSAAFRSTSAFEWKGDPQICAILPLNRGAEIDTDDSAYSRVSSKIDARVLVGNVEIHLQSRSIGAG
jgi:hypothetical protein